MKFSYSKSRTKIFPPQKKGKLWYMCAVHFVVINFNSEKMQKVEIAVLPSLPHDAPLHVYMCMLMELLSTYFVLIDLLHVHIQVCLLCSL